jgi:hypothetical protein
MVGGASMGQSAKGYAGSLVNKAKGLIGGAPPVTGA